MSRTKRVFEVKKIFFPLFHKCSLLDIQNKLAKIEQTTLKEVVSTNHKLYRVLDLQ